MPHWRPLPLARPDYLKSRALDDRRDRGGDRSARQRWPAYSSPTSEQTYAAAPQPTYAAAPQPTYAAAHQPAYGAPPGFQLVQYAQTAGGSPSPAAGGGAPRKVAIGKSQQDPSKTFAAAHLRGPACTVRTPPTTGTTAGRPSRNCGHSTSRVTWSQNQHTLLACAWYMCLPGHVTDP